MSQKYDEYLEKHRQAVKKAYQWIAAYIPELTDVEATRNIEFHDMSKNTPDEYTPYDNIQAVCDRLREAKEQRQLDIQINQAIALVNRNHRRKKYDAERLSAGSSSHCSKRFTA